jgi:hypothetical protein
MTCNEAKHKNKHHKEQKFTNKKLNTLIIMVVCISMSFYVIFNSFHHKNSLFLVMALLWGFYGLSFFFFFLKCFWPFCCGFFFFYSLFSLCFMLLVGFVLFLNGFGLALKNFRFKRKLLVQNILLFVCEKVSSGVLETAAPD